MLVTTLFGSLAFGLSSRSPLLSEPFVVGVEAAAVQGAFVGSSQMTRSSVGAEVIHLCASCIKAMNRTVFASPRLACSVPTLSR